MIKEKTIKKTEWENMRRKVRTVDDVGTKKEDNKKRLFKMKTPIK